MANLQRRVGASAAEPCHAVSARVFRSRTVISVESQVSMPDWAIETLRRGKGMANAPMGEINATEPRLPPPKSPRLFGGACLF